MNCTEFEKLSMLYFDGEANEQQISVLKEHVDICNSCRASFRSMKSIIELLEIPEEFSLDDSFTADVMKKVSAFEESKLKTSKFLERIALPASATFLVFGVFLWMFLLNNVNVGLVLYRMINFAKVVVDVILTTILSFNLIGYLNYINEQFQVLMPITLVFVGIIISVESNKSKNQGQV